jgi:FkbM family methyltransferase
MGGMLRSLRGRALSALHSLGLLELARRLRLPEQLYRHLAFHGCINIPVASGKIVKMTHEGYSLENDLYWGGYSHGYEAYSRALWSQLAQTAGYIVDVGANTGIFALTAAVINPKATVLALEPVVRTFSKLKANVALTGCSVQCVCQAASAEDGIAIIHDINSEHQYSASLNPIMLGDLAANRKFVQTAKLDNLLSGLNFPRLDLLKIDVELHEPEVVAGGMEYISRYQPSVLIEILNEEIFGKLQGMLSEIEYWWFWVRESGRVENVANRKFETSDRNFLLCRAEIGLQLGLSLSRTK